MPDPTISPAEVATAFIASYERGDQAAILALSAPDAIAEYVPWGDAGRSPVNRAVNVWARYAAAFDDFSMPVIATFEDSDRRTAIVATLNSGRQRSDVDGIPNLGAVMACPHLFIVRLGSDGRIDHVQVWCDQVTLFQQLGFPVGFKAERAE